LALTLQEVDPDQNGKDVLVYLAANAFVLSKDGSAFVVKSLQALGPSGETIVFVC
jgi:hypothetical protein